MPVRKILLDLMKSERVTTTAMRRLGILFPPCGAEYEYYLYGEAAASDLRISLMGARCKGGDREHEPRYLRETASLENVLMAGRVLKPLKPDAVMWACTSGSFISGLAHAKQQVHALSEELSCPASSTSLAFVQALNEIETSLVAVLGSYVEDTTLAFVRFLQEAGVTVTDHLSLGAPSGPDAARLDAEQFKSAACQLSIPKEGAILVPDTAVPTIHLLAELSQMAGCTILSANQVSIWQGLQMIGVDVNLEFWRDYCFPL